MTVETSVRRVSELDEALAAVGVFDAVWAAEPGAGPVRHELVWAVAVSGAYASVAWQGDRAVGASLGWLGIEDGRTTLHSHVTAVDPHVRSAGIGLALKEDQRQWCLEHGIEEARWTFDPLVRRNAWFNLMKLGVTVSRYVVDFYGALADSINRGDSDRLVVAWDVAAAQAGPAIEGETATALLAIGDDGRPVVTGKVSPGVTALCPTPEDIESLRRDDPDAAFAWRLAVRETLGAAVEQGWRVRGFSRSGSYVLDPPVDGR